MNARHAPTGELATRAATVPSADAIVTVRKGAEDALRASEARLRALVAASSDVVYRMSPDWREMRQLVGRQFIPDTDTATTDWLDKYIHPEDQPRVKAAIEEAIRTRSIFQLEHRVLRVDGGLGWTFSRAVPLLNDDGTIAEWVGTATDITERKQVEEALRESAERFTALADNIAQLAWMADEEGWISWYNRRWFEYTGTTLGEMEGWGWQKVHHPDHVARVTEKFKRHVASGEPWEDTFPLRARDGTYRWFLSRAAPVRNADGKIRWFGTNTDITEQLEAERALREADQRKSEFLAVLSHELRNPLAPIRNSVYLLENAPPGSAQAARAREVIRRQADHLTRLVEDLLDVTRITRGKVQLHRERTDLAGLVHRTIEDHRGTFARAEVELGADLPAAPVWSEVDATRIAQVLGNLLTNAAKFTPPRGSATVAVRARADQAVITVRDTGIGIAPAELARMFEPFAQESRGLARSRGGLGLGLALSKGLVELHGGSLTVQSPGAGQGAVFTIALPLSPHTPEPAQADAAAPAPRPPTRRVLLIDDNADAAETLRDILESFGHEVAMAPDGTSGMERARDIRPDVVICDLGLPDVSGYEVARALRRDPALGSIRLIALSGYGYPEDKQRSLEAGFEVHFTRPAQLEELAAAIVGSSSPER